MNVLSLFDGMSCGRIALERAGINVSKYYASEIDKYAITVTQANYPDTVQLGDVTNWREWDIDWAGIDLLIGGSPCQGFSFAGKQLAFDDPRSKLFFVYVDILNHIRSVNPEIKFMLENVKMKKEYLTIISEHLGVQPVLINSALVSAQNRQRYYWANWEFGQPDDKRIVLSDILENGVVDSDKSYCIDANCHKVGNLEQYFNKSRSQLVFICGLSEGIRLQDGKRLSRNYREGYRIYSISGKAACLTSQSKGGKGGYSGLYGTIHNGVVYYRKLTPVECERLQTVPDNYTAHVSNTQRYKMLGNGWTVDVVAHIFNSI